MKMLIKHLANPLSYELFQKPINEEIQVWQKRFYLKEILSEALLQIENYIPQKDIFYWISDIEIAEMVNHSKKIRRKGADNSNQVLGHAS